MFCLIEHKVSLLQQINNHIEQSVFLRKNKHDQFKKQPQWNFICSNYGNDQHWSAILFHVIGNRTMWFDCGKGKQKHFSQTHELEHSQKVEIYKTKAPLIRCFLLCQILFCFVVIFYNFFVRQHSFINKNFVNISCEFLSCCGSHSNS